MDMPERKQGEQSDFEMAKEWLMRHAQELSPSPEKAMIGNIIVWISWYKDAVEQRNKANNELAKTRLRNAELQENARRVDRMLDIMQYMAREKSSDDF